MVGISSSGGRPPRRRLDELLLPKSLIKKLVEDTRDRACHRYGDTKFLVIELDRLDDELTQGLEAADAAERIPLIPSQDALGYGTVVSELPGDPSILPSQPSKSERMPLSGSRLAVELAKGPRFVVPLRKRKLAGKAFSDRISVGRARNNDIVLRHASISKFHAWFESDGEVNFFLGDARSTNTTAVRGALVSPGSLVSVNDGDLVRFGNIGGLLCPPMTLWDALAALSGSGALLV